VSRVRPIVGIGWAGGPPGMARLIKAVHFWVRILRRGGWILRLARSRFSEI
jgi:hypothetical protein